MARKKANTIDLYAFYTTEWDFWEFGSERLSRNWHARLRRRGFVRSPAGEAYYHPVHWRAKTLCGATTFRGPGDVWFFDDALRARTTQAKAWLWDLAERF